jgi:hypothetical protein
MMAPTGTTIAPKQGKDMTRSSAGGKVMAKTYPNGFPKVSNNNLRRHPRKAIKTTLPSSIMIFPESDGVPSDEHEGKAVKSSAKKYKHEGETYKKSPTKKRAMKQVVKEKKEKKRKLLQVQKGKEDRMINSFVQRDGDDQFLAACALTNMLKRKEKKTRLKRGETFDASGDEDNLVKESLTAGDLETTSPSTDDDESILSEPAPKKVKVRTTPDAPLSYLAVLNEDQNFTIIQEVVVAKEEYTPSNPKEYKFLHTQIGCTSSFIGMGLQTQAKPFEFDVCRNSYTIEGLGSLVTSLSQITGCAACAQY